MCLPERVRVFDTYLTVELNYLFKLAEEQDVPLK